MEIVDVIYDIMWFSIGLVILFISLLLFSHFNIQEDVSYEIENSLDDLKSQELGLIFMRNHYEDDGFSREDDRFKLLSIYYSLEEGDRISLSGKEVCRSCSNAFRLERNLRMDAVNFRPFTSAELDDEEEVVIRTERNIFLPGIYEAEEERGMAFPVPTSKGEVKTVRTEFIAKFREFEE